MTSHVNNEVTVNAFETSTAVTITVLQVLFSVIKLT